MDWTDVLDGNKKEHPDMQTVNDLALAAGYPFFSYDGRVYRAVSEGRIPQYMEYTVQDGDIKMEYTNARRD